MAGAVAAEDDAAVDEDEDDGVDQEANERLMVKCLKGHRKLTSKAIAEFTRIPQTIVQEILRESALFENVQGMWRLMTP